MPLKDKSQLVQLEESSVVDDLDLTLESKNLLLSQQMAQRLDSIKPKPLPKRPRLAELVKKIPLLTGFLKNVDSAGNALSGLAKVDKGFWSSMQAAASGFQYAGLALHIIDFFRIPALYVAFAVAGEKPPIKLSKNARWAYSAVIVALSSIAIALPVTAPPIGIAIAGLTFVTTTATMIKILYQRHQLRKKLADIEDKITIETNELNALRNKAATLETNLLITPTMTKKKELANISTQFDQRLQQLQTYLDQKFVYEEKLKKKGLGKLMDKGVAMALTSVAITGLTLALFFPPAGLIIFGSSAAAGLVYFFARAIAPAIQGWVNKLSKKSSTESNETEQTLSAPPEQTPTPAPSNTHSFGSVATTLELLQTDESAPSADNRDSLLETPIVSPTLNAPSHHPLFDSTAKEMEVLLEASQHGVAPNLKPIKQQREEVTTILAAETDQKKVNTYVSEENNLTPTPFHTVPSIFED